MVHHMVHYMVHCMVHYMVHYIVRYMVLEPHLQRCRRSSPSTLYDTTSLPC